MTKITLNDLANLQNENTAVTKINQNNSILEAAIDNTLSRNGQQPNQMQADLDMNSNDILNVDNIRASHVIINGHEIVIDDLSSLPSIIDGEIFGNISGQPNPPVGNTLTAILDHVIGTTQGSILMRNGSTWDKINPGLNGQYLVSHGTNQNLGWATAVGTGDMLKSDYDTGSIGLDVYGKGLRINLATEIPSFTIPSEINYIQTYGYDTTGLGAALYTKVLSEPSHAFKQQSADGTWWEVSGLEINPLMIGAKGDGTTDDTSLFQTTFDAYSRYKIVRIPSRSYKVKCGLEITSSANFGTLIFDNCILNIDDTGPKTTLRDGITSGKIGIYFNNISNFEIQGSAQFLGQGVAGTTQLAGVLFEKCNYITDRTINYLSTMAAGRCVFWCNRCVFGDMICNTMYGRQTFDDPAFFAGTADVVLGCYESVFGRIISINNYKPVRYLSVTTDENGAYIDNSRCQFGFISGTSYPGSAEGSLCSVRSAVDCHFDGVTGTGFSLGFYVVRYDTDTPWSIDRNTVGSVEGVFLSTGASADVALNLWSDTGMSVGDWLFDSVNVNVNGEFGILLESGNIKINNIVVRGSPQRSMGLRNTNVLIGSFESSGQQFESILIGNGVNVGIDNVSIMSGPVTSGTGAISYNPSFGGAGGHGAFNFGNIRYLRNGSANNYSYVFFDLSNGFNDSSIWNITGTGEGGQCLFASSDVVSVQKGVYLSAAIPTAGTYLQGNQLWKSAPAAGASPGWVCTAGGTPGTWKGMANLAV